MISIEASSPLRMGTSFLFWIGASFKFCKFLILDRCKSFLGWVPVPYLESVQVPNFAWLLWIGVCFLFWMLKLKKRIMNNINLETEILEFSEIYFVSGKKLECTSRVCCVVQIYELHYNWNRHTSILTNIW